MINNRITLLIDTYCHGNKSEFAKKVGVTPSVITNITGMRQGAPSFDVLEKIANAFPMVSCEWLLTGRGNMEKKNDQNINDNDLLKDLVNAQKEIIKLQKENAELMRKSISDSLPWKEKELLKRD